MSMYVRLFHGRSDPEQQMHDWGTDGPIVGPVHVSWTYGHLRLNGDEMPTIDGMFRYSGVYYGDAELIEKEDFLETMKVYKVGKVTTFEEFQTQIRKDEELPEH